MKENKNVVINKNLNEVEKPLLVNAKYCAACAAGAICLIDGPIPDFEIAAIAGVFGIFD